MKLLVSKLINDLEDFKKVVIEFSQHLSFGSVVLLQGDLASGKTSFVVLFCEIHQVKGAGSPTYSIHNRYTNNHLQIDHFDLYRLSNEDEIQASGFYDLFAYKSSYKFIEWPEKIEASTFENTPNLFKINFKLNENNSRSLELFKIG